MDSCLYINNKTVFPAGYKVIEFKISYKPFCDSVEGMTLAQWYNIVDADQNGLIQGTEISKVTSLEIETDHRQGRAKIHWQYLSVNSAGHCGD